MGEKNVSVMKKLPYLWDGMLCLSEIKSQMQGTKYNKNVGEIKLQLSETVTITRKKNAFMRKRSQLWSCHSCEI